MGHFHPVEGAEGFPVELRVSQRKSGLIPMFACCARTATREVRSCVRMSGEFTTQTSSHILTSRGHRSASPAASTKSSQYLKFLDKQRPRIIALAQSTSFGSGLPDGKNVAKPSP